MCLQSFVRRGHPVTLYVYEPQDDVPAGVSVQGAGQIVNVWEMHRFQNKANFSDYFRWCLLYERGGWWTDLDMFCLQPFAFAADYVFSSQLTEDRTNDEVNCGVVKAPQGSPVMEWLKKRVESIDTRANDWAELGPRGLLEAVGQFGLQSAVQPHTTFCPLHYFEAPANVLGRGSAVAEFGMETVAVHLWNEELRRAGEDKNASYPESLYERLQNEA